MPGRVYRWMTSAVALHSLLLGTSLLVAPVRVLGLAGWAYEGSRFFPAQSGLFLLILGVIYVVAVERPALAWVIVLSKALAVLFLVGEAVAGNCPPVVYAAAGGDAAMGLGVLLAWRIEVAR
jgi:hypothetical protein